MTPVAASEPPAFLDGPSEATKKTAAKKTAASKKPVAKGSKSEKGIFCRHGNIAGSCLRCKIG